MKTGHAIYITLLLLLLSCGRGNDFDATGTFEATEITVSGQEQGTIVYINADEGSKVKRGGHDSPYRHDAAAPRQRTA